MQRREFLKAAALGAASLTLARPLRAAQSAAPAMVNPQLEAVTRPPNMIFILSDDVGLGNIGCCGGTTFQTPRIDALARGGTRFETCYSMPLCGPSRATILTGRYPFRTGMISNTSGARVQPANEIMLPRVLKPAGYVTAQVGKWNQLPLQPAEWGFDEYLRFQGSGRYWDVPYTLNGQAKKLTPEQYMPDVMHDFLLDFITRHKDQPFYVHYAMSHVHAPIQRTPDSKPGGAKNDFYADNIAYMDKLVGKLVDELDRLKLRENTLLVFVGDNGTAPNGSARSLVNGKPISGRKGTMLEGGSRVPLIVNWPGTTPAGQVRHDLTDFSDFFPTLAALAGAPLPAGVTIDGHSFLPQIKGQTGTPREWVYVELSGKWYARDAQWKLNNAGQLFDLKEAPYVERLVAADSADPAARAARTRLQAVLDQLNPAAGKQLAPDQKKAQKAGAGKAATKKAAGKKAGKKAAAQQVAAPVKKGRKKAAALQAADANTTPTALTKKQARQQAKAAKQAARNN